MACVRVSSTGTEMTQEALASRLRTELALAGLQSLLFNEEQDGQGCPWKPPA